MRLLSGGRPKLSHGGWGSGVPGVLVILLVAHEASITVLGHMHSEEAKQTFCLPLLNTEEEICAATTALFVLGSIPTTPTLPTLTHGATFPQTPPLSASPVTLARQVWVRVPTGSAAASALAVLPA